MANSYSKTPWLEVNVSANGNHAEEERERFIPDIRGGNSDFFAPTVAEVVIDDEGRPQDSPSEPPKAVVAASATAGGVLGCLIGGIGCAILAALGSTYAVKNKGGTCVGDCARAMG